MSGLQVDDITLVDDGPDGQTLVIETAEGTRLFYGHNIDELLDAALGPYRAACEERDAIRAERAAAGGITWDEYVQSVSRVDPEFSDLLAEQGDNMRKRLRENGPLVNVDPADDSTYLDAA